jgi:hypothetical protein
MNLTLVTHLIAALAAAAGVWVFQDARMDAAVADVRLEQSNERMGAVSKARADERGINKTYQGALNAARDREALLRTEIDHLRRVSDSLRDQSADAARRLAAYPPGAVLEYAIAVNAVFDDCRAAYAGMVEKADGHASDVRTFREAWPVIPTRPDAGSKPRGH